MGVARIDLGNDMFAVVDAADVEFLSRWKWRAWKPSPYGGYYAYASCGSMHRLLMGHPKGLEVDHVNRDTLDNRRSNLRACTHVENMRNGKFALATCCPRGHAYDGANTYVDGKGRRCRKCAAERQARLRAAETPEAKERRRLYMAAYFQKRKAVAA